MKKIFGILMLMIVLLLPLMLHVSFHQRPTLYLFCWSSLIKPELVSKFENLYNCRVVVDTYDSNEAMYTKLKFGGSGYDIIFPSNYFLELMSKQGMLRSIEWGKIPNAPNIDWGFVKKLGLEQTSFGVPFAASFTGVAYRQDRVPSPEQSWNIFADVTLAGRMTMLNDMRDTLGAALLYLGYSVNTTRKEEISQAGLLIQKWKKNLAKFESEQYKNGIISGEYLVAQGYTGDSLQAALKDRAVAFFYPKEGSTACIDFASITQTSENTELAYAFLNFLLNPQVAAENMEHTRCRTFSMPARALLNPMLRDSPLLFPEEYGEIHLETISPVGSAQKYYLEEWNVIKTS